MEKTGFSKLYSSSDKQIMKQAEDSLNPRMSKAPVTPLLVKDRKLDHHTLGFFKDLNSDLQNNG